MLVARLALGLRGPDAMNASDRVARAASSKVWLASLALPSATRTPFARCVDATANSSVHVVGALRGLIAATAQHLDGPAVRELELLTRQLAS